MWILLKLGGTQVREGPINPAEIRILFNGTVGAVTEVPGVSRNLSAAKRREVRKS